MMCAQPVRSEIVYDHDSGTRKAAILLLTLGDEVAREVFRRLSEEELKQLNIVANQLNNVSVGEVLKTLEEFKKTFSGDFVPEKSAGQVFQFMLERGLGHDRAQALSIIPKEEEPFDFCNLIDVHALCRVLSTEHPQTAAIVISFFDPKRASEVLEVLSADFSGQIVQRIATLGNIDPDLIHDISNTLREEFKSISSSSGGEVKRDGESIALDILKQMKEELSDTLITEISDHDQMLAEQLRALMFTFQDLIKLDSRSMQRLMREVDTRHLSVALRNTEAELQEAFLSAISSRAAELLRDDMDSGGPVRVDDITAAQQQVLDVALRLDSEGVLILPRGDI